MFVGIFKDSEALLSDAGWQPEADLSVHVEAIWLVLPHFQYVGLLPVTMALAFCHRCPTCWKWYQRPAYTA